MIVKSKSRSRGTWKQLLKYMERGCDERSILVTQNITGEVIADWLAEFKEVERVREHRRKGSVVLYHEVLSFHDEDTPKIDSSILKDLTRQYIDLRAERGCVVAMSHHTEDHVHIHFCISGVEFATGKSMRMSQSQFTAIKRTLQAYQQEQYPTLSRSIADHGQKARIVRSELEYLMKQRTGKPSVRDSIGKHVLEALHKSTNLSQFQNRLANAQVDVYFRNGRLQGVLKAGRKFRLTSLGIAKDEILKLELMPSRLEGLRQDRERSGQREYFRPDDGRGQRMRRASGEPTKQ